jgi:ribosomal protein S12 methylthiotransferase accessory factor
MIMEIGFPGGLKVDARFRDHRVTTDQPEKGGGTNTAPAPFEMFMASLGTCAGFYALRFCQQRNIDTSELGLTLETARDPESKKLESIDLHLALPPEFPEKYEKAIVRAIDQCAVKKVMADPPEIRTLVAVPAVQSAPDSGGS